MSFLQGEKRQLAKANKEETEETEEEEVSVMHILKLEKICQVSQAQKSGLLSKVSLHNLKQDKLSHQTVNCFKQESKTPPQPAPRARERIESAATEEKKVTKSEKPSLMTNLNVSSSFPPSDEKKTSGKGGGEHRGGGRSRKERGC